MSERHPVWRAAALAPFRPGSVSPINRAMIAITIKSSISVNPFRMARTSGVCTLDRPLANRLHLFRAFGLLM
jgi:hypothetical protein